MVNYKAVLCIWEMEPLRRRTIRLNSLALSFAIPCVGMLFVMLISKYAPFGKYSMLYSDMYHQYYPFFVEFRRALRSGDGLLYTWSVGLGMDYLGLIAYYLASPLNLLSVLVPEGWLLEFFSLLMPLKLGLAGLSFGYFLKKVFGAEDFSIAVFGGLYGLCAWALGFQWNIMWLDTFALLPLVALGTVSLLREKKVALYTVTLFLSIFCNYYIGFFTCIFVFLLFFVYQICRWGGWKKFFCDLIRIGVFSLLAIGMTAILTWPALTALQTTQSSVNKFPQGFKLNIASSNTLKGLLEAMGQVAGNMGGAIKPNFKEGLPNLYCGIACIPMLFLYLMAKDVCVRDKLCAVALLVFFILSFLIRQLDYIWHGFHFTNMIPYRFSFLYSFVVLYMAYSAWRLRKTFTPLQIVVAGLLATAILLLSESVSHTETVEILTWQWDVPVYLLYNGCFLVVYFIAFLYGAIQVPVPEDAEEAVVRQAQREQRKMRRAASWLLLSVMCVELVGNLICFGLYFTGTNVTNYPKGTTYTASVIRYMGEREKNTPFYRAETTHSQTLNDGALNGYHGITAFTSSANVKTTLFMQALGFSAKNTYNRYLYEETSPVANLFLGLKYMIDRDGKDKESAYFTQVNQFGDTTLLENNAYLPLGFLAEPELGELTFDTSRNAFAFQNDLFIAATGLDADVWHRIPNLQITGNGTTITEENDTGFCHYKADQDKTNVTYTYVVDRDGFACVHLNLPKRNDYIVSVNGVELFRESISLPQLIAVGDVRTGDTLEIRIVCKAGENSTMTISAAVLNEAVFRQGYDRLNASVWQLTDFTSTKVTGTVDCNRDGLLYTSIPQNGNWKATVDGKEVEPVLVGECMLSLPLKEGTHSVVLTYENQALKLGWKITALCTALFLLLCQRIYKPQWKKGKGKFQK